MRRCRFPALVVALGLLAPVAASGQTTSCPGADTTISASTVGSAKAAVFCIVNAERVARGLPALSQNDKLAGAAQQHSDDMVAKDYFAHLSLDGLQPSDRILAAGYSYGLTFENIATGQTTPREAVADWLASTHGHCQATLDPSVIDLGVGIAPTAATLPGQIGGTWTEEFGLPLGHAPGSTDTGPAAGCPYTSFAGLAPAKQPDAPASSSPPSPGGTATTPTTPAPAPTAAPPQQALTISLRHAGSRLTVSGAIRPQWMSGQRVRIVVSQGGRVIRHLGTRLDSNGRFRIRLSAPAAGGPLTVSVRVGKLRVTRTVGR